MADYGVNIKVGVQGQQNARQLGEQIREIVSGLEAADRAFTRFSNNLKSFDQRRAQRKINEELDKTAQKYRELDRLQRQLLANDNSAIKSAERRAKLEEFISKNISAGRIRRQSARQQFLAGDPGQYAATIGPQPDRIAQIRKIAAAEEQAARQVAGIRNQLFRNLNRTQIDLLQDKIKREMDAQQEIFNNAMRLNKKAADDFDRRLAQSTRDRSEAARLTGQTSPIGGAVGIPGSPAALAAAARAQRIKSAQGSALIGGAFPLLFGQGLGAAVGGAAGGFGGGMIGGEFGFGLSLVGTQIGSIIDQLAAKAATLGQALNLATADIDAIVESLGMVGSPAQEAIQSLEELAGEQVALEEATRQLSLVVGDEGVEALKEFGDASTRLGNALTQITTQILAAVAQFSGPVVTQALRALEFQADLSAARQSSDPRQRLLQGQLQNINMAEDVVFGRQRAGIEAEMVALQRKIKEEAEAALQAKVETARVGSAEHVIAKNNLAIAQLDGDLTNERVFRLERANIFQEARKKLLEKGADVKLIELERDEKLLALTNKRNNQIDAANEKARRLSEREQKAIDRKAKAVEREMERADKAFDKASRQLDDITNKHEDKMAFEREYSRLIQEGSTPAAAKQAIELQKQLLELDRIYDKQLKLVDAKILSTEETILELKAAGGITAEYEKQLNLLKKRREELEGKKGKAKGAIERDLAPETGRDKIEAEIDRVQGALNDLINPANQVILAAQAIGDAFAESFRGLITGSMSAQEALANLFQRTADHFADMAAQMIAKQIQMKILGIALSFFNPGASQGGSFAGVPNSTLDSVLPSTSSLADAAAATPLSFASGGYASGPTRALVGEGGQGEYVIPESKMRESMARYSRGARGSSVIPDAGASGTSGEGGGVAVAAPIDVRYSIERINNIDYVTNDQFQQGLQQAAAQGAQRGEQNTLKRLQMSGSTRRRLGM